MVQMSGRGTRRIKSEQQSPIEFPTIVSCSNILEPLSFYIPASTNNNNHANSVWPWNCNVCPAKFQDHEELKQHMMEHLNEMPAECRVCSLRFKTSGVLAKHLQEYHLSDDEEQEIELDNNNSGNFEILDNNPTTTTAIKKVHKRTKSKHSSSAAKSSENNFTAFGPSSSPYDRKPKPKSKPHSWKRIATPEEITHCYRCKIDFASYEHWRQHAVYSHAIVKNPCPIVEMNYVDVQTIMKATLPSVINTFRKTEKGGQVNEKIRLTFCRDKGSYVVRKSTSIDESEALQSQQSHPELVSVPEQNGENSVFEDNEIEADGQVDDEPMDDELIIPNVGSPSPEIPILKIRFTGKEREPVISCQLQGNVSPTVAVAVTAEPEAEAVSPSINKENMPSETEQSFSNGERRWAKSVHEVSGINDDKSPAANHILMGANSSSEIERIFNNAGNSQAIIQNDIHLNNGAEVEAETDAEAEVEDLEHLSTTTATAVVAPPAEKTSESLPSAILEKPPKNFESDPIQGLTKDKIIDGTEAECILPNLPDGVELTVMISEEIRSRSGPNSQTVNLEHGVSLNDSTTTLTSGRENIKNHGESVKFDASTGADPAAATCTSTAASTTEVAVARMSPVQNNEMTASRYENITPPSGEDSANGVGAGAGGANESVIRLHLLEETEIREIRDESSRLRSAQNLTMTGARKNQITNNGRQDGLPTGSQVVQSAAQRPTTTDEDIRCRVCQQVFPTEDELDTHFSDSHFRVGTGILEPESPCPPAPPAVKISEVQTIFTRRSVDDRRPPVDDRRASVEDRRPPVDGRRPSAEGFPQLQPQPAHQRQQPDIDSALARQLMQTQSRQLQQRPPMTTASPSNHFNGTPNISLSPLRPGAPPPPQPNLQAQNHIGRQLPNGIHHLPMNPNTVQHMVSTAGGMRPPITSVPPNYTVTQSLNSRPLNSMGSTNRPQVSIVPTNNIRMSTLQLQQQLQHQQHQNHQQHHQQQLQQQHQQQLQQQQQQQQLLRSQSFAQAQAQSQVAQAQQQYQQALHATRMQMATLNNSRPMPLTGVRHNSTELDGPRIVDVTSIARTGMPSQAEQLQHLREQQMLSQQQQQQQQMQHRSLIQGRPGSNQNQSQQEMQHQFRLSNGQGTMNIQTNRLDGGQKRHGSPLAPTDPLLAAKQARLEGHGNHPGLNLSRPAPNVGNSPMSDLTITQRISPQTQQTQHSPTIPLDRNVANAIGSVNAGAVNSVRLGNAITLSVCATADPRTTPPQNLSPASRNGTMTSSPVPMNTNSVASALAVRGVTVTPASPPVPNHESASQRYPVNVSISPNPAPDLTNRTSPISVIQRADRSHSTVSPTATFYPPMGAHQFAVPRAPAPRGPTSASAAAAAIISHGMDRPDRPPTVDLTDDDSTLTMTSTPGSRHPSLNIGRPIDRRPTPQMAAALNGLSQQQIQHHQQQQLQQKQLQNAYRPTRPTFSCNLCNVLFTSSQSLDEHKLSRHNIRTGVAQPNSQIRNVTPGIRAPPAPHTPQLQQQMRPVSPGQQANRTAISPQERFLYIPLLDLSHLDPAKLRRLEEMGIMSIVPLNRTDRSAGPLGMPVISLRADSITQNMPWDSVLPMGPVQTAAQVVAQLAAQAQAQAAAAAAIAHPNISAHRSPENGGS